MILPEYTYNVEVVPIVAGTMWLCESLFVKMVYYIMFNQLKFLENIRYN